VFPDMRSNNRSKRKKRSAKLADAMGPIRSIIRELQDRISQFVGRDSAANVKTLLSIIRRWPEMRTCSSRDPLFASVVAEFSKVIEVEKVPG